MGTCVILPDGDVTCATTRASFNSTYDGSSTSTVSLTASPGSTLSWLVMMLTSSGTASTSQRTSRRQNSACVVSLTATFASIFQIQESWIGIAIVFPRP